VGDVVTMTDAPCGCGSRLPRVARIAGRAADVFWGGDGARRRRLINLIFTHALEYVTELREWQAEQTGRNDVLVRLEPLPGATIDLERARLAIDRELSLYDFPEVRVRLVVVPRLDADPRTGKFRRMVSQIGPDDPPSPHFRSAARDEVRLERQGAEARHEAD
jgi:phenylacetate-coenzyme A ligase PaaK-like adenylate-forming protein